MIRSVQQHVQQVVTSDGDNGTLLTSESLPGVSPRACCSAGVSTKVHHRRHRASHNVPVGVRRSNNLLIPRRRRTTNGTWLRTTNVIPDEITHPNAARLKKRSGEIRSQAVSHRRPKGLSAHRSLNCQEGARVDVHVGRQAVTAKYQQRYRHHIRSKRGILMYTKALTLSSWNLVRRMIVASSTPSRFCTDTRPVVSIVTVTIVMHADSAMVISKHSMGFSVHASESMIYGRDIVLLPIESSPEFFKKRSLPYDHTIKSIKIHK
ncbi:hypothetical protein FISHEDRAFT_55011 [Fistulina hepatica ATCC 64428]|uniref:Uncharacterized protein n=1 Tax=Fistulina hepatica ATCC 64428 TaxID=1128425 RepID=A0A0D7APP8_9AGAR|nr:hypothetical protein FISHEDRAFT_55011 [Fistulina hepatica ATCC 64428]